MSQKKSHNGVELLPVEHVLDVTVDVERHSVAGVSFSASWLLMSAAHSYSVNVMPLLVEQSSLPSAHCMQVSIIK